MSASLSVTFRTIVEIVSQRLATGKGRITHEHGKGVATPRDPSKFLVDGIDQGDPLTNRPYYRVNLDAVQELKMQTREAQEQWELYDVEGDRTATTDLADRYPEKVAELAALWEDWPSASGQGLRSRRPGCREKARTRADTRALSGLRRRLCTTR